MSDQPEPQMIAGRFSVERQLGTGGMSTVVLAQDTVLSRPVAVKMLAEHLASDKDFVTRFRHEALSVARLQHPNIVQVFDSGLDPSSNRQYIVMEYVDGTPLSEMMSDGRRFDPDQAVAIGLDACEALQCAHEAGIVHRDVKPANLIIARDGTAKLTDFGIAKATEHTGVTKVGSVIGTVAYLSPEQATGGDTTARSDVYSLAVVMFQMLAGRLPYEYKSITELAIKQRESRPPALTAFNPLVARELDRAIRVALSYDPERRYGSAAEFHGALLDGLARRESDFVTNVMDGGAVAAAAAATTVMASPKRQPLPPQPAAPVAAAPAGPPPSPAAPKRRTGRRILAIAAVLAALAAAAAGGFLLGGSESAPVVEDTVENQIDGLRGFLREHGP
jgi:serine/threonine-protein kinase